jgi:phosphoglycolate phosphatase-like HAD superfamily hydrolase
MIRNLIWDVDGTLFDTYPGIARAFLAAITALGKSMPLGRIESLAKIELGYCGSVLAGELNLELDDIMLGFSQSSETIPVEEEKPFAGVLQVCEYILSSGGFNGIITHRGRESTTQLLEAHNLAGYFSDILTRNDGFARKPSPAAFNAMIKKNNFLLEETLTIGDREIDILAGKAAGIQTCLFGTERTKIIPDIAVTDYGQLLDFLQATNGEKGRLLRT